MDNFQIETAQNVNIQQNVAGIGERIAAYLIDGVIWIGYIIAAIFILGAIGGIDDDQWGVMMLLSLPLVLYHLLWETFWNGKTPGKRVMNIRVARLDGTQPRFSNYLVRWLLRVIDISLASGGIAVVLILMRGKGQRLGDMAAGTTVISERKRVSFNQTTYVEIPEDYKAQYPQVTVFDDAEMQKIKTVYSDARRGANHNVIVKLSEKVASVMGVTPQEKPLQFIAKVIKDYNYFTQQ
ncbi:RDD family protein [Aquimarina rhabdastrellae]